MSEQNKDLVRRFWAEQDRRKTIPDEMCTPDFTAHIPGQPTMNLQAIKQFASAFFSAFPDLKHTVEDALAEGDKVAVRLSVRGTHKADLMGIPPTGRQIAISAMATLRVSNGKATEMRAIFDQMSLMQQIGVIPALGGPSR